MHLNQDLCPNISEKTIRAAVKKLRPLLEHTDLPPPLAAALFPDHEDVVEEEEEEEEEEDEEEDEGRKLEHLVDSMVDKMVHMVKREERRKAVSMTVE